ncbi:MAG TPA: four helix bundle protein [Fimbriiglobus sp.]|nr:four helix bundle protein [Fimbriiglobus sp.]
MMNQEEAVMADSSPSDLKVRTRRFALRVIRLYGALPTSVVAQTLGKQVLRSGTSVGAYYREACRTRSDAEFISLIEGGLKELEETIYWFELIVDAELFAAERLADLMTEADELMAILTASVKTVKSRTGRA